MADHAANAALDCAVDWQRVDHDGLKAAKLLQPNWRVCFDGALRGNGCASAGMVVMAYCSTGECKIVYRDFRKMVLWSGTYLEMFLGYLGALGTP